MVLERGVGVRVKNAMEVLELRLEMGVKVHSSKFQHEPNISLESVSVCSQLKNPFSFQVLNLPIHILQL